MVVLSYSPWNCCFLGPMVLVPYIIHPSTGCYQDPVAPGTWKKRQLWARWMDSCFHWFAGCHARKKRFGEFYVYRSFAQSTNSKNITATTFLTTHVDSPQELVCVHIQKVWQCFCVTIQRSASIKTNHRTFITADWGIGSLCLVTWSSPRALCSCWRTYGKYLLYFISHISNANYWLVFALELFNVRIYSIIVFTKESDCNIPWHKFDLICNHHYIEALFTMINSYWTITNSFQ